MPEEAGWWGGGGAFYKLLLARGVHFTYEIILGGRQVLIHHTFLKTPAPLVPKFIQGLSNAKLQAFVAAWESEESDRCLVLLCPQWNYSVQRNDELTWRRSLGRCRKFYGKNLSLYVRII